MGGGALQLSVTPIGVRRQLEVVHRIIDEAKSGNRLGKESIKIVLTQAQPLGDQLEKVGRHIIKDFIIAGHDIPVLVVRSRVLTRIRLRVGTVFGDRVCGLVVRVIRRKVFPYLEHLLVAASNSVGTQVAPVGL